MTSAREGGEQQAHAQDYAFSRPLIGLGFALGGRVDPDGLYRQGQMLSTPVGRSSGVAVASVAWLGRQTGRLVARWQPGKSKEGNGHPEC